MIRSIPPSAEVGLTSQLVAEPETCLEVGRAAGLERVDRGQDLLLVGRARRRQDDPGVVTERDHRDRVALAEAVDQLAQRILDQLEPVAGAHRARGVDHEGQRGVGAGLLGRLACLDPDPEQDVALVGERGRGAIDRDREGLVLGGRIALVEGVDPFLDTDAGRVRDVAVGDVPLGDGVRRGVDIHREGREMVLGRIDRGVLAGIDIGDAAIGRRLRLRRRSRPAVVLLVWGLDAASARRSSAATCCRDEGDRGQGQVRLAHRATSLLGAWGDSRLTWAGPPKRNPQVPDRCHEVHRRATAETPGRGAGFPSRRGSAIPPGSPPAGSGSARSHPTRTARPRHTRRSGAASRGSSARPS